MPTATGEYTKKEIKRAEEDLAYWKVLEDLIPGFKVLGWTWRNGATYVTLGQYGSHYTDTLNLTGVQRDLIVTAFNVAKGVPEDASGVEGISEVREDGTSMGTCQSIESPRFASRTFRIGTTTSQATRTKAASRV